jgi:hypothetical protein
MRNGLETGSLLNSEPLLSFPEARTAISSPPGNSEAAAHHSDSFPRSGCTSMMCMPFGVAHHMHIRDVFPKGLHIVDVQVLAKRLHIKNVFPQSGCTSKMCYPFGVAHHMHIRDVFLSAKRKGLHIVDVFRFADVLAKRLHIYDVHPLWVAHGVNTPPLLPRAGLRETPPLFHSSLIRD